MMKRAILAILLSTVLASPALAQSTANPVVTGYLTTSGCVSGQTSCFVQYGATGGGSVNVSQFGGSNVVTGTGAGGAGIPRFTVSNDSTLGLVAGTAIVGKVGIDQTTPGTTNAVQPAGGAASAAVNVSTATTTQIVAASGSTVVHLTNWVLVTTLANNVTWESGDTGGSCANPVALTGAMPFGANGGASVGSGFGDVLVLPAGKALCLLTSAATQISGSVAYRQF